MAEISKNTPANKTLTAQEKGKLLALLDALHFEMAALGLDEVEGKGTRSPNGAIAVKATKAP